MSNKHLQLNVPVESTAVYLHFDKQSYNVLTDVIPNIIDFGVTNISNFATKLMPSNSSFPQPSSKPDSIFF